jgi:adenylate cyclase
VNVAARLEGQSRGYGVRIVLGEATREAVPDLATLELDLLRVRGRAHTERVFALLGGPDLAGDPVFAALRERHGFMLDTYRAQDWPAATAAVMACREALSAVAAALARQDVDLATLYDLYAARIATLRGTSPIPEWDGVFPEGPSGRDGQDIRQPGIR